MKTLKRAGIAAAAMAGLGILAGVWVLTKDVVIPRNEKGDLDFSNIQTRDREKDQLFSFLGRDLSQIDITIREVDYSYLNESSSSGEEAKEGAGGTTKGEPRSAGTAKTNVKERKLTLARVGGKWVLTAPVHAQADQSAADGLANAIAELRIKGREENVNPLDPKYGLDNPCVIARISRKGNPDIELLIGRDTPVGSDVYMMIKDQPYLYYASSSVKTSLVKQPKDLRDKKVAHFEREDVKAVILEGSAGRIVCEQTGTKKNREWWLTKPVEARADDFAVDDVVDAIRNLEAKDFVDDVKSLGAYGLDKPTVTVRFDFGKARDDVVVKLGKRTKKKLEDSSTYASSTDTAKELIYCMAEGRDEIFLVEADVEGKLNKKPIDLRDTDIVDFETHKANKIVLERKGQERIELVKTDAKWSIQKPEFANADSTKVDDFLWDLKDLKAAEFLDKEVSPTVSGLNNPEVRVQVYLEGQEAPVEIKFGYPERPNAMRYYCQTSSLREPVFVLDSWKEKIPKSVEDLKEKKAESSSTTATTTKTTSKPSTGEKSKAPPVTGESKPKSPTPTKTKPATKAKPTAGKTR